MCMRCDGYSWEEIDRHTDLMIRVHGFMAVQVEGSRSWTYSVGAFESWDQPDLLVFGVGPDVQRTLLELVAEDYVGFGEVRSGTLVELDVELVTVDERHFRDGLVASWEHRYSMSAATGDFLQIVPGPSWYCDECVPNISRLDDPSASAPDAG